MARIKFGRRGKPAGGDVAGCRDMVDSLPTLGRNMVLGALAILCFILSVTAVLNGGQKNIRTKPPNDCDVGWVDIFNTRSLRWTGCGCEAHATVQLCPWVGGRAPIPPPSL